MCNLFCLCNFSSKSRKKLLAKKKPSSAQGKDPQSTKKQSFAKGTIPPSTSKADEE